MYDAVDYIRDFNPEIIRDLIDGSVEGIPLMLTGEGSSRIFPGKNAVHRQLAVGNGPLVLTESSTDLAGKSLNDFIVIGASNSGKTKELVNLFRELQNSGHRHLYGLSCNAGSVIEKHTRKTLLLETGKELAVAATKSVVAQALFYDAILLDRHKDFDINTEQMSAHFEQALDTQINRSIINAVCNADIVYFAGYNNGVAEELTLKTNEIIRKRAAFLPGTYLLHGIEEIVSPNDIIIMVDAYPDEFEKIKKVYSESIGTTVIVFSEYSTPFDTVRIPAVSVPFHDTYVKLAAGWNLLVEAGIQLGIDPDKPVRARKIGNEAE